MLLVCTARPERRSAEPSDGKSGGKTDGVEEARADLNPIQDCARLQLKLLSRKWA